MSAGSKTFRRTVLERDDYTCQACFTKENLTIHHIKPRAKYPELKNNPANGLTLCTECHQDLHAQELKHEKKMAKKWRKWRLKQKELQHKKLWGLTYEQNWEQYIHRPEEITEENSEGN